MSDDRIFNSDELYAPINLRKDIEADNIFFQRLLAHPSIKVERFYPSPDSLFEYIGSVTIGGQSIPLTFDHKGEGKGSNPSALKARINLDDDTRTLIRQVIIENAPALRGRATKKPVERQPGTLQIRVTPNRAGQTKSSGESDRRQSLGYLGEERFTKWWAEECPELPFVWLNEGEQDAGLPYDVLIAERLAVDVKATQIERAEIRLSEAENVFRQKHLPHHAIALVSFQDKRLRRIDLYLGEPLRKVTVEQFRDAISQLEPLEFQSVTPQQPASDDKAGPYLCLGTYVSSSQRLTLASHTYVLQDVENGNETTGPFYLQGHELVLQDTSGKQVELLVVGKGVLQSKDDEFEILESEKA
ncbi:hypothetical protein [Deinococcus wulumuqiensis]|uniref:DUF3883 domain-containing protein n=1 Tax=Deinococcus wulumuqiensis TaxID=980427 RepID=A0AAV4K9C6_9DEIO|nr:hypothetical protein [Deinococcus wulumuqiensis]QII22488.1 hypothetical protein G6R31_16655 [Deinococcus wulumuqiensis R12]GGI88147.1 hypothetical protein GCM10010914_23160 [Deinococcus wulumuqiensis]GGP30323.1 hypothetical protein GCM10008021_19740 [Deinococcus wulumuqiensis]